MLKKPAAPENPETVLPIEKTIRFAVCMLAALACADAFFFAGIELSMPELAGIAVISAAIWNARSVRWLAPAGLCFFICTLVTQAIKAGASLSLLELQLALFLTALSLRDFGKSSQDYVLSLGLFGSLVAFLAASFNVDFLERESDILPAAIGCLLTIAMLSRFSDDGWLQSLVSKGRQEQSARFKTCASVLGPWLFGTLLYNGFGSSDSATPVDVLLWCGVISALVYGTKLEARRLAQDAEERNEKLNVLRSAATTDRLTGLPNRVGVEEALSCVWARFKESGENSAVILFDLDHFKSINDSLGHCVGDAVLKAIRGAVTPVLRPGDVIGRWGGEEFLCVLPGAKAQQLDHVGERLRSAVEGLTEKLSAELKVPLVVSASFGVAQFHRLDCTAADAVKRADKALYASKDLGRNCVSIGAAISLLPEQRSASTV